VERAIRIKLEKMVDLPPTDHLWITYWLAILKQESYGIGLLGFKGVPDYRGQIEIGYGIDQIYGNQGYTTEAAASMIHWAFQDARVERIVAPDTLRDNPASNRILQKLGFSIYKETALAISWALERRNYIINP
jgi:RimJ/RimL family protein N-acetyltransferase